LCVIWIVKNWIYELLDCFYNLFFLSYASFLYWNQSACIPEYITLLNASQKNSCNTLFWGIESLLYHQVYSWLERLYQL
jgi:hypothetical protein